MQWKARQLHDERLDPAVQRVPRVGKGRRDQHAVVLQHPPDLPQRFFRLRYDVQGVGHDHHIKGASGVGQLEHILCRKMQLRGMIAPPGLTDHLRRGVGGLHRSRRADDLLGDQPCAGGQLQNVLMPYHRADQRIHLLIGRRVLPHKPVIPSGVSIPERHISGHMHIPFPILRVSGSFL